MKLALNYQREMYFHSLIRFTFVSIVKTYLLEEVDEQRLIYLDQGKDLKWLVSSYFHYSFSGIPSPGGEH